MHTCTHTYTCTHSHRDTDIHIYTHTDIYTRTYTCMHTQMHTIIFSASFYPCKVGIIISFSKFKERVISMKAVPCITLDNSPGLSKVMVAQASQDPGRKESWPDLSWPTILYSHKYAGSTPKQGNTHCNRSFISFLWYWGKESRGNSHLPRSRWKCPGFYRTIKTLPYFSGTLCSFHMMDAALSFCGSGTVTYNFDTSYWQNPRPAL